MQAPCGSPSGYWLRVADALPEGADERYGDCKICGGHPATKTGLCENCSAMAYYPPALFSDVRSSLIAVTRDNRPES